MKSLKIELEKHFANNWTQTPIQFQGSTFTQPTEWISLVFIPLDRSVYSMCDRKLDTVMFKVLSYSDNPTKVIGLEDEVKKFLECWDVPNHGAEVGVGKPDGLGIIDLDNGVFEAVTTYLIESYN